jgi:redox-sensitive bicupin YhaK (pirin superfamily)
MAAVSADTLTLPRITHASPQDVQRPVLGVVSAPSGLEGEGFPVRRTMAGIRHEHLDPFIMMDHMGEVDYGVGEPRGTDWHPHRGFETVTYLIEGSFIHQDTHGGGGVITEGATQWMTAGSGLLHIETPPESLVRSGGLFHGLQLWVNLPAADKFAAPRYQGIERDQLTLLASADGASLVRVIAGELDGHGGPGSTHTPITYLHASVTAGGVLDLPWNPGFNALIYALQGSGTVGAEGAAIREGQLAVLGAGDRITARAEARPDSRSSTLELVILGGRPRRARPGDRGLPAWSPRRGPAGCDPAVPVATHVLTGADPGAAEAVGGRG